MKHYPTQQLDHRPASFWQQCVLLLLLNSLALIAWADFRQTTISGNSGFVAELNQVTLANHRDHFRSLLNIKNLAAPNSSDGNSEQHWLVYSTVLDLAIAALLHTAVLHYLTLSIIADIKYHSPLTRAPPRQ